MKIIYYIILYILRKRIPTHTKVYPKDKTKARAMMYWLIKDNPIYLIGSDGKDLQPKYFEIEPKEFYNSWDILSKTWIFRYTKGREVICNWHNGNQININFYLTDSI